MVVVVVVGGWFLREASVTRAPSVEASTAALGIASNLSRISLFTLSFLTFTEILFSTSQVTQFGLSKSLVLECLTISFLSFMAQQRKDQLK